MSTSTNVEGSGGISVIWRVRISTAERLSSKIVLPVSM